MRLSNKIKNSLSALKKNDGSTIVIVMMTMLFVATLGATLLYMSYTSVLVRSSEQHGVQNFYDASGLMDALQVGFHEVATAAVDTAYSASLEHGGDETIFDSEFLSGVLGYRVSTTPTVNLTTQTATGVYSYNMQALSLLLQKAGVAPEDIYIAGVSGEESDPVHLSGDGEMTSRADSISFENISVTYIDPETRHGTTVSADIILNVPEFNLPVDQSVALNYSGLPNFALVAGGILTDNIGASITGSAYGGNVSLQGAGDTTLTDGMLISAGYIDNGVGHTLSVTDNAQIWTRDLTLQNNASFDLLGSAYLLDDLTLAGDESSAVLAGNYYGFGNDIVNPEESSSILVNGLNTTLDFSASQQLMLAGHSFITVSNTGVMMGESVSVRPNQMAYLIPLEFLEGGGSDDKVSANPIILNEGDDIPTQTLTGDVIWTIDGNDKYLLTDYGASVQPMIYPLRGTTQRAVYYFLRFDTIEHANQYFRDYFTEKGDDITKYLNDYVQLSEVAGYVNTSGNYIEEATDDDYTLGDESTVNGLDAQAVEAMADVYDNLTRTLSNMAPADSSILNPYDYIVDTGAVAENAGNFLDENGNVVAVAITGNYQIDSTTPSTVRFVVATGDITVGSDFTGFAIAGGDIYISGAGADVSSAPDDVRRAFTATNGGVPLSELLNVRDDLAISGGGDTNLWDMSSIVGYENWQKS